MGTGEPLESGYGPAASAGDNLCNDFVQETAASFAALADARGDRVRRIAGVVTMTDAALPLPFWNRAVLEQPVTDSEALLNHLRDFYGSGDTLFLLDSAWPTPDLRTYGFTLMGHPPMMVRPVGVVLPPAPPELRVERASDAHAARDLERTLVDGYPAPPMQPFTEVKLMTAGALGAPGWHHLIGYVDGRAVAVGSSYVGPQLLRVENIATLPEARGHGYGLAITAATMAIDAGKPATLVASDLGRPIYEKLGFVSMLRCTYWLGARA
jgi:hypothetical protein